jgi:uncharacterized protein
VYINTHQLKDQASVVIDETVDLSGMLNDVQEVLSIAPAHLRLKAVETARNTYRVDGSITTEMTYRCARCLSPFSRRVEIPFDEVYATEESLEDGDVNIFDGERIDLAPAVEQAVLLSIPLVPLCETSCRGLCPQCGTNLNVDTCGCERRAADPRWEALTRLFEQS